MAGVEHQKLKLLYLLDLLERESDAQLGVTMKDILAYLETKGCRAERKSIYRDLEVLIQFGYRIEKLNTAPVQYALIERTFDLAELKFMVDAVESAIFIPQNMTDILIDKLASLTSCHQAQTLRRQVHYMGCPKGSNQQVYQTIETLHDAICREKKVSFKYIDYTVDKKIRERHGGERYSVSPFGLIWKDDRYYLYGHNEKNDAVRKYRVDRMSGVKVLPDAALQLPADFSIEAYANREFSMFSGEEKALDIRFDNELINVVIDRFGQDIPIIPNGQESFVVHVRVAVSQVFFAWLFQFGGKAKIIRPASVAEDYRRMLEEALDL